MCVSVSVYPQVLMKDSPFRTMSAGVGEHFYNIIISLTEIKMMSWYFSWNIEKDKA